MKEWFAQYRLRAVRATEKDAPAKGNEESYGREMGLTSRSETGLDNAKEVTDPWRWGEGCAAVNAVAVTCQGWLWLFSGMGTADMQWEDECVLTRVRPSDPSTLKRYRFRSKVSQTPDSTRGGAGVVVPSCKKFLSTLPDSPGLFIYSGRMAYAGSAEVPERRRVLLIPFPSPTETTYELSYLTITHEDTGSLLPAQFGHTMIHDEVTDTLAVFGGYDGVLDRDVLLLIDPVKKTWKEVSIKGETPLGRCFHICGRVPGHPLRVWVWGGFNTSGCLSDGWVCEIDTKTKTGRWTPDGCTYKLHPEGRQASASCVIWDQKGHVLLQGGYNRNRMFSDWWVFDMSQQCWFLLKPPLPSLYLKGHSAVCIPSSTGADILVIGGQHVNSTRDLYSINQHTFKVAVETSLKQILAAFISSTPSLKLATELGTQPVQPQRQGLSS
eukprot:TRINITY_DN33833_c0_g1_i1.p1 TRINITY_DN33833_c0_g1~~TRINITY_DN33833_c0_g1_i1.p1  ORF type:complete len:439 (+),score=25.20 TRINITY_DN33833_c0_g1_i1:61-1377(+)